MSETFTDVEVQQIIETAERFRDYAAKKLDRLDGAVVAEAMMLGTALFLKGFQMTREDKLESFGGSLDQAEDMTSGGDDDE